MAGVSASAHLLSQNLAFLRTAPHLSVLIFFLLLLPGYSLCIGSDSEKGEVEKYAKSELSTQSSLLSPLTKSIDHCRKKLL